MVASCDGARRRGPDAGAQVHSGGKQGAVSTNEITPPERAVLNPEVRALLGQRLRAYYDHVRHIPVSDTLADLLKQVEVQLDSESENGSSTPTPHEQAPPTG